MDKGEEKIRFASVFSDIENIHLIKDPGMIPYTMQKEYGFLSVVPLSSLNEYSFKDSIFKDIETPVIKDSPAGGRKALKRAFWIVRNARKIDVLNLFFFDRAAWSDLFLYRLFNHSGLIYIHLDTDGNNLLYYRYPKNPAKTFIIKKIFLTDKNLRKTLWGIQNRENAEKLKGTWPFKNLLYVPDGIFWEAGLSVRYEEKENILLTVARNGSRQKRTDILLEGFAKVAEEFPLWKLRLVGTVEESFKGFIDGYFTRYPELRGRVVFTGPVYDRKRLESIYAGAKVFCLTSAWESFGIVTAEAISKGCYIVASDIAANAETTDNERYGMLFKNGDVDDFAKKLRAVMSDEELIRNNFSKALAYAGRFSWKNVLKPVYDWITEQRPGGSC